MNKYEKPTLQVVQPVQAEATIQAAPKSTYDCMMSQ